MNNSRRSERPSSQLLAAYLEQELTASEAAPLEHEIAQSSDARLRLQQLRDIRDLIGSVDPDCAQLDLAPAIRWALTQPPEPATWRPTLRTWSAFAAVSCVAVVALLMVQRHSPSDAEFHTKGTTDVNTAGAMYSVTAYRAQNDQPPRVLGPTMATHDGLLFSYTNSGARPFEFLMIFGVDSAAQVHWYYPFFDRFGTDPSSIPISPHASPMLLPDVIEHDLRPGPIQLEALFSHRALRVSEVEAWLATKGSALDGDSRLLTIPVAVIP